MARSLRSFAYTTSYHVTMRCNNQAFGLRLSPGDGGRDQSGLFAVGRACRPCRFPAQASCHYWHD
jgi:hypothetical protein